MKISLTLRQLRGLGLGDVARKALKAVGFKKDGCAGCEKRRKALNRFNLPK